MSIEKRFKINYKGNDVCRLWAVGVPGFGRKVGHFLDEVPNPQPADPQDNLFLTSRNSMPKTFLSYADARSFAKRWNALPESIRDKPTARPVLLSLSIVE